MLEGCDSLAKQLRAQNWRGDAITAHVDTRDLAGGTKRDWIKKGVPVRIEIGPRDLEKGTAAVAQSGESPDHICAATCNYYPPILPAPAELPLWAHGEH